MHVMRQHRTSRAFALPTVLIASIVLLTILAVSVTATAAVRTTLKNQYYIQLAQVAGEAGVSYAKACLAANGNVPQWTDTKPLTPATDCAGNVVLSPTVKALVVAGGGSGGGSTGGGGGAGGVVYDTSLGITATSYPVVVGAGGAIPGNKAPGLNGGNSSFNGDVALGGGGGGYSSSGTVGGVGQNGGSGGGGQNYSTPAFGPGTGSASQGNNGAPGGTASAGGGGGAGGAGTTGSGTNIGGNGGPGAQYNITGSMIYYAAGGGGGNGGVAGTGGNTTPGPSGGQAPSASANTGNGGTGGYAYADGNGGAGGSGVVIISFPISSGIAATGGTVTTSGGNEIHKFTSNGTFTVTSAGSSSCPSDPRCSVTINGNVRSSFKVPKPLVDSQGRALTIPNSGYVEVTRTSNGAVWRTYNQPSVQAAVVPDLCSGNATAARGWAAAVKTAHQDSIPATSSAQTISMADGPLNAGQMYFRKDFNVSHAGNYEMDVLTSSAQDIADTYIDGQLLSTSSGSLRATTTALSSGCHTLIVRLTNATVVPNPAYFTASLSAQGNTVPIVVSDTSWRVDSGDPTHFSETNYYEAAGNWEPANVLGVWANTALVWGGSPANWGISGDPLTMWLTTNNGSPGVSDPGDSYAWFRNTQPFTLSNPTTVRITAYCDDKCDIYLDGQQVQTTPPARDIISKSITIQPGVHTFGVRLYNGAGSSGNPAGFLFSAYSLDTQTVLSRSDAGWDSTTFWTPSGSVAEPYSYDATFTPVPAYLPTTNVRALVVGGGGGGGSGMGGGGGGGGVVERSSVPVSPGSYPIVVGGGGTGAPAGAGQVRGSNGGNSSFSTIRAYGGGGGASDYNTNNSPPGAGASAGGSAGSVQTLRAAPIIGQGNGSAVTPGSYYPTGGGGAGGGGSTNPATGGIGVTSSILGTSYYFGGGGGGSGYTGIGGNGGAGGAGGGAIGATTGGSGVNAGSPGGGGAPGVAANTKGGNGGAVTGGGGGGGSHYNATNNGGNGGSGTVIISFPTGAMNASASGSYNDFSSSTPGFTTYLFFGPGVFTVTSIN